MQRQWLAIVTLFHIYSAGDSQLSDNAPPVILLERRWSIPDNEKIGTVVTKVRGDDSDGDILEYGLEKHFGDRNQKPLPFAIDNETGVITVNQSLHDRSGEQFLLYVTASDGSLSAKTEVLVDIFNSSAEQSGRKTGKNRPPFPTGDKRSPFGNLPPGFLNQRPPFIPSKPKYNNSNTNFNIGPEGFNFSSIPAVSLSPDFIAAVANDPGIINNPSYTLPPPSKLPPAKSSDTPVPPARPSTVPSSSVPSAPGRSSSSSTPDATLPASTPKTTGPPSLSTSSNIHASESLHNIFLTVFTLISLLFVVAVGILVVWFRRSICYGGMKKKKDDMNKESDIIRQNSIVLQHWRAPRAFGNRYEAWDNESTLQANSGPPAKSGDPWEFPRHHIKIFSILGEGCFGQVWKCEAINIDGQKAPQVVAVKTLRENAGERERSDLLQELEVMKMLDPHPNVVRLLGCCTEKDPIFLIMEYVACGKLQSFLRNSRAQRCYDNMHGPSDTLTSRDLTSFCYQVARGMQFLSSKGIIHRDLAARNVLVAEDHTCKVADFGFARDVITSHVYERKSEGRLPIRWMAPESLYDNIFSVKSDIWSFGVLVWEIVTLGSTPYPGLAAAEVMKRVRDGYRLDKPEHCRRELYNIMYYCWDKDPKERPNFSELVDLLEQLLLSETEYIELERFPDHSYYNMVSLSGEKL
ncbi:unnamed protein product [Bemisia tabaci]|uniref:receptor protein-tyrosine kinase n=1 Tax=Bemisia tabaci TaxID=7038 RepID=A0A9P0CCT5_BEMTA|nr:unnamed protein product [Bemisia tabaci]